MRKSQHVEHKGQLLYLDMISKDFQKICRHVGTTPEGLMKALGDYLDALSQEHYNCKTCGGLLPELVMHKRDKAFCFTCFKIMSNKGETIAQTDYPKMSEYLILQHGTDAKKLLKKYEKALATLREKKRKAVSR